MKVSYAVLAAIVVAIIAYLLALPHPMGGGGADRVEIQAGQVGELVGDSYEANYTFNAEVGVDGASLLVNVSGWFVEGVSSNASYVIGRGAVTIFGKGVVGPYAFEFFAYGDRAAVCLVGLGCRAVNYTVTTTHPIAELVRRYGSREPGKCGSGRLVGNLYVINETLSSDELRRLIQFPGGSVIGVRWVGVQRATVAARVCMRGDLVLWANSTVSASVEVFGHGTNVVTRTYLRLVSVAAYNATRAREVAERVADVAGR